MGRKPRKTASKRWLKPSGVSISDLTAMDSKYDYEYLIKYKNMSYLHVQWLTAQDIGESRLVVCLCTLMALTLTLIHTYTYTYAQHTCRGHESKEQGSVE